VNLYLCFPNITRHIYLYFANDFTNGPLDDKKDHFTFQRTVRISVPNAMLVVSGASFAYRELRKSRLTLETTCKISSFQWLMRHPVPYVVLS